MTDLLTRLESAEIGSRECLTPGCYYQIGLYLSHTLEIRVRFPFSVETFVKGEIAVKPGPKLQRYEQRNAERERFAKLVHDALEPIMAEVFETMKPGGKIDQIIEENRLLEAALRARDGESG